MAPPCGKAAHALTACRYDKLVGMFSGKDVPAVGGSIGSERVFALLEAQMRERAAVSGGFIRSTATDVLVASIGNGLQTQRMKVATQLWDAGIKVRADTYALIPLCLDVA